MMKTLLLIITSIFCSCIPMNAVTFQNSDCTVEEFRILRDLEAKCTDANPGENCSTEEFAILQSLQGRCGQDSAASNQQDCPSIICTNSTVCCSKQTCRRTYGPSLSSHCVY